MRSEGRPALFEREHIPQLKGLVALGAPAHTELRDAVLAHDVTAALDHCDLLVHEGLLAAPAHVLVQLVLIQFQGCQLLKLYGMGVLFVLEGHCRTEELLGGRLEAALRSGGSVVRGPKTGLDPFLLLLVAFVVQYHCLLLRFDLLNEFESVPFGGVQVLKLSVSLESLGFWRTELYLLEALYLSYERLLRRGSICCVLLLHFFVVSFLGSVFLLLLLDQVLNDAGSAEQVALLANHRVYHAAETQLTLIEGLL